MAQITNPKIELEVVADTTQAKADLKSFGEQAKTTATEVNSAGKQMLDGWDVGPKAQLSAKEFEKAEKTMIAAVRRTSAEMALGGKQSADYIEFLAKQRGVAGSAEVQAELARLRQIDTARKASEEVARAAAIQRRAAASLEVQAIKDAARGYDALGNTAKQTTAALRQVPAQFTDIVVSLQGGQNPMTVLLQQGGQLKDVFGGIVPAAKALGGYVLGLVNPFTMAAGAAAALGIAYYQGAGEAERFNKALILSGNDSRIAAQGMADIARSVSDTSLAITQSTAAAFLTEIAFSSQAGAENLQRFTKAALEFEAAGGGAASEVGKAFADLAKEPLKASLTLNESMNYLTASTYEQIKALESQGKFIDAARVAQEAYSDAIEKRTPSLVHNIGYLETAWNAVARMAKTAWDNMRDAGRTSALDAVDAQLQNAIATGATPAEIANLQTRRDQLLDVAKATQAAVVAQNESNERVKAGIALSDRAADTDGALASQRKKVAEATAQFTAATKGLVQGSAEYIKVEKDYLAVVTAITKVEEQRGRTPRPKQDNSAAKEREAEAAILAKLSGINKDYYEQLTRLQNIRDKGKITEEQYVELVEELIKLQPGVIRDAREHADAIKKQAEAAANANVAFDAYFKHLEDIRLAGESAIRGAREYSEAVDAQVKSTEFELSLMGKSNTERAIAIKQYQIQIGLERELDRIRRSGAKGREYDFAVATATAAADKAKANAAAEVVNAEFERVSQQIEQDLTDALMRGFESGKGFAEVFRDTVANMFRTLVLRPVVQAIVQPVAGSITSALGMGGQGVNALNMGSSLYSAGSTVAGWLGLGASTGTGIAASAGTGLSLAASSGGLGLSAGAGTGLGLSAATGGGLGLSASSAGAASLGAGSAGAASLSAALPWIGAGLAVLSLIDSLDDSGTMHTGGLGGYSAKLGSLKGSAVSDAGLRFGVDAKDYTASSETAAAALAKGVAGILDQTASTFGQKAGYYAATAFADDTSDDGAWGALMVKLGDKVLLDWGNNPSAEGDANVPRVFADGEAGATEYAAAVAGSIRDLLIEQTPDWADTMLTALGDAPTIEQLAATVGQINQVQTALTYMGDASTAFAGLGADAANALIGAMGGAQQAIANLQGYYTNFYSETERQDLAKARLTETLGGKGIDLPGTRAAFRELVDNTLASGDTDLAAFLIEQSAAYAEITPQVQAYTQAVAATTPVVDEAAKAMEELAKKFQSAKDRLADTGASLAVDLLTAQGDTAGASALQRSQYLAGFADLDAARLGELATIYDQNQAIRAQITLAEKLSSATASLIQDSKSLAVDLLRAQGDEAGALAAERAIYLSGFADLSKAEQDRLAMMYDQTQAIKDQITAAQKAIALSKELADSLPSVIAKFLTPEQNTANSYRAIAQDLVKAGVSGGLSVDQLTTGLTGATKDQIAQAAVEIYNLGTTTDDMRLAIVRAAGGLADLKDVAIDAAEAERKRIAQERAGLQDQLNQLTLTSVDLRALELAKLDEANRPLQERIWLLEEEKRVAEERNGLMTSLYQVLGNTGALRAEQLAKLDPANQALQQQIWQIEDAKAALEKALQAESESANAAQQAAQERVSTLKSIFDALKSNIDSLYESVEATKEWAAVQANAFIDNALANAKATGYMPELGDLNSAIAGARGGLDKQYATEFDRQRETLVLAGKLSELQDIAGPQLTTAEQQLKAAEAQVEALDGLQAQGRALLDSMSGNVTATLSVRDAIAQLSAAVLSAGSAAPQSATAAAAAQAVVPAAEMPSTWTSGADSWNAGGANFQTSSGFSMGFASGLSKAEIGSVLQSNINVARDLYESGWSQDNGAYGQVADITAWAQENEIPGFAAGGLHMGGLRIVGENGPELEATGPARIWNAQQLGGALGSGNTARLEALVEGLTKKLEGVQAELKGIRESTEQMAENIDEVTEGGNAMRSRSVGVTA